MKVVIVFLEAMHFPVALDNLYCNRFEMAEFAKECAKLPEIKKRKK